MSGKTRPPQNTPEISLAVKAKYRSQGIGTSLLKQIEQEFLAMGIIKLSLSVNKQNPANKLYERCGYKLFEEKETAITMIIELKKARLEKTSFACRNSRKTGRIKEGVHMKK